MLLWLSTVIRGCRHEFGGRGAECFQGGGQHPVQAGAPLFQGGGQHPVQAGEPLGAAADDTTQVALDVDELAEQRASPADLGAAGLASGELRTVHPGFLHLDVSGWGWAKAGGVSLYRARLHRGWCGEDSPVWPLVGVGSVAVSRQGFILTELARMPDGAVFVGSRVAGR